MIASVCHCMISSLSLKRLVVGPNAYINLGAAVVVVPWLWMNSVMPSTVVVATVAAASICEDTEMFVACVRCVVFRSNCADRKSIDLIIDRENRFRLVHCHINRRGHPLCHNWPCYTDALRHRQVV